MVPECTITSPTDGTIYYNPPVDVTVTVDASSPVGSVTLVEFFIDDGTGPIKVGENTTAPYTYTITAVSDGEYTLTAKVTNTFGAVVTSLPVDITVEKIVYPEFTGEPVSGFLPLSVDFTDTSEKEFDSWYWEFGDGETSTERNPTHIYTLPGSFTVSLTGTDPGGDYKTTKVDYITVSVQNPNFVGVPRSGYSSMTVEFTDTSLALFDSWYWDFGDGEISTERNPTHLYTHPGFFSVTMTGTLLGIDYSTTKITYILITGKYVFDVAPEPYVRAYLWGTGVATKKTVGIKVNQVVYNNNDLGTGFVREYGPTLIFD